MTTRREILIDAYNVIYADPKLRPLFLRDAERARDEFLAFAASRLPADGSLGVVVFDAMRSPRPATETGRMGRARVRGLQVVYARESADAWIQARIRDHPQPESLTVVTSDKAILDTARAHGVAILRTSDFLQLASRRQSRVREIRASEKPSHQSAREIDEWEKLFGRKRPSDPDEPERPKRKR